MFPLFILCALAYHFWSSMSLLNLLKLGINKRIFKVSIYVEILQISWFSIAAAAASSLFFQFLNFFGGKESRLIQNAGILWGCGQTPAPTIASCIPLFHSVFVFVLIYIIYQVLSVRILSNKLYLYYLKASILPILLDDILAV